MSKELNKAPVEQAGGDERAGLRAAAKWHRGQRNAFEEEAEMHRQRYENTNRPDSLTAEAEYHRRLWETASAMAANHLDYAAGFEEMARAALAQPSTAPELELPQSCGPMPDIDLSQYNLADVEGLQRWAFAATDELTAFDRIVGELRTEIAMLRSYESEWELLLNQHEQERDAALARIAELGANLGAALGLLRESRGFVDCDNPLNESGQIKLLEEIDAFLNSPVAQAQHSVPEGYALIPTRETEAMHDAVMALLYKGVARTDTQKLLDAYIAAAPGKGEA
ncbi:TPA: hypothetical protein ACLM19_004709 [Pseudomonas aeruginosa]